MWAFASRFLCLLSCVHVCGALIQAHTPTGWNREWIDGWMEARRVRDRDTDKERTNEWMNAIVYIYYMLMMLFSLSLLLCAHIHYTLRVAYVCVGFPLSTTSLLAHQHKNLTNFITNIQHFSILFNKTDENCVRERKREIRSRIHSISRTDVYKHTHK